jgi:hypothetical protein
MSVNDRDLALMRQQEPDNFRFSVPPNLSAGFALPAVALPGFEALVRFRNPSHRCLTWVHEIGYAAW